jgi:hypothetical protein
MLTERSFVSHFNVRADGRIEVRKTTEVARDGTVIATQYWRRVLEPNDSSATDVLGDEPFYLNLAQQAWASLESSNA